MLVIINFFIELALLRRAPQDLPASTALFSLVILVALVAGLLLALTAGVGFASGLVQSLLDLGLMLGALSLALRLVDRRARFLQTATAVIGVDILITLLALFPVSLARPSDADSGLLALAGLLFLLLVAWSIVATGHILRHAFGLTLLQGAAIAIGFDLLSFVIIGGIVDTLG
ncbi:hypothetical protein [Halochromatium glycolicum]|uniref:Uncharacterized protein n=1 Tax=Halochromatium glycolicum TaxID=85075 RepID=A0AAJ0U0E9_9GAMM|nr:hypothetical protein [Halochromatium glycolicum]MBK1703088.1 hypothetical protein [Halochromatium glycolicum]